MLNNEKNETIKNINDDIIKLAILDFIAEEDKDLEKERLEMLKKTENIPTNEQIDKFKKAVRIETKKIRKSKKENGKHIYRAAAVLILGFILLGTLAANAEAIRLKVLELFQKDEGSYSTFIVKNNILADNEVNEPAYIPKGYQLNNFFSETKIKIIEYVNEEGQVLSFIQQELDKYILDTENTDIKEVKINEFTAILLEKEDRNIITWTDNKYTYVIEGSVDEKEIIKMARSVL